MAEQLRDKVTVGVAWSVAEKLGSMLMQMVVSIVVARMLMPEDFGVLAILTFFTALMVVVVDSGFSQTLIRKTEPTENDYKSVFVFNVVTSLVLYAVMTAVSPAIAAYYNQPVISKIAPVLFLMLPINALSVIQNTIFARQFRFATLSRINFASATLAGASAITMAWCGFGVWSLVAQRLVQVTVKAVLLWWRGGWRCQGRFDLSALSAMGSFSFRLMGTDIISYLYNNIAQLFIGKMHSAATLGYYNQAQKLKELPVTSVVQSFQSVTYPALANVKEDKLKFADSYLRVLAITAAVIAPVMVGMVAVADDMFMLMLGQRWMPTVPYFKILSLAGLFYPISMISYNVLKVAGDGRVILRLEIIKKTIMTIILALAIPHSVMAIAWGMVVMAVVELMLNGYYSLRFAELKISDLLRILLPIALLTTVMYFAVRIVGAYVAEMQLFVRFIVQITVGIVVYVLGALIFRMRFLRDILQSVKRII